MAAQICNVVYPQLGVFSHDIRCGVEWRLGCRFASCEFGKAEAIKHKVGQLPAKFMPEFGTSRERHALRRPLARLSSHCLQFEGRI